MGGIRALPNAVAIAPLAAPPPLPSMIILKEGGVNGLDREFDPPDSDTPSGGHGAKVDGISCGQMVDKSYHVHAFIGLLVNGREVAIPDQIGMVDPGVAVRGFTNSAHCFYGIHTHDATGMIHFEVTSEAKPSVGLYTLGDVLDVWGERISATSFGRFSGPVHVFYAYTPLRTLLAGVYGYAEYNGAAPRDIKMYSHMAVWIEVGTVIPGSRLPKIRFYTEY